MDLYTAGDWHTVPLIEVYVDGAWRRVVRMESYVGAAWKDAGHFVDPLTVSADPTAAIGFGTGYITTNAVTVTPAGGLGPYTYSWSSGSYARPDNPTSATTTFSGSPGYSNATTETLTCTVTDALGSTASVNVDVTLDDFGGVFF